MLNILLANTFTLPSCSVCLPLTFSSLHSLASFRSVATGPITLKTLCMGQQAETIYRFIPCSLQSKTSLLAWTVACASLCSSSSVCFHPRARCQCQPASNFGGSWGYLSVGLGQSWGLQKLVSRCPGCPFVLNLIILVGATMYIDSAFLADPLKSEEKKLAHQLAAGRTSVSIAMVTFVGILAYHIFQQLRHTKLWKKMPKLNLKIKKLKIKQAENCMDNFAEDITESGEFDELREPLLDDLSQPTHSVV